MELTLVEAAAHLGRNEEMVRRWLKTGRLVGYKRVGRWFIEPRALAEFQRVAPIRRARKANRAT